MFQVVVLSTLFISAIADPIFKWDKFGGRIVGGHEISILEAPYQVAIDGKSLCGGSIISKNLVLTAAHCFEDDNPDSAEVWAGSTLLKKGSKHKIEEIYIHKRFQYVGLAPFNDIAIVKVSNDFEFDETRRPINLFNEGDDAKPGSLGTVTGWGSLSYKGAVSSTLRSVTMPIISKNDCASAYGRLPIGQICTSAQGKDPCQGDSGGPLVINGILAGIVSYGSICGNGNPSVYTEVAFYQQWIQSAVQKLNKA